MNRPHFLVVVAVAVFCLTVSAAHPRPEVTAVTPQSPAPSRSAQPVVVHGHDFAAGLSLSVTTPSGNVSDYRGNAIMDLRDTTFRVALLLADPGTYRLVVINPDGQTSMPFGVRVKAPADSPSVHDVKPTGLRVSTSPQVLTVEGARFNPGLIVLVTDPAGGVKTLAGDAIEQLLPESFRLTLTLELAGRYDLIVTNPDGKTSNHASFSVGR